MDLETLAAAVTKGVTDRIVPVTVEVEDGHLVMKQADGSYWPRGIINQLETDFAHGPYHDLNLIFEARHEHISLLGA